MSGSISASEFDLESFLDSQDPEEKLFNRLQRQAHGRQEGYKEANSRIIATVCLGLFSVFVCASFTFLVLASREPRSKLDPKVQSAVDVEAKAKATWLKAVDNYSDRLARIDAVDVRMQIKKQMADPKHICYAPNQTIETCLQIAEINTVDSKLYYPALRDGDGTREIYMVELDKEGKVAFSYKLRKGAQIEIANFIKKSYTYATEDVMADLSPDPADLDQLRDAYLKTVADRLTVQGQTNAAAMIKQRQSQFRTLQEQTQTEKMLEEETK